MESRKIPARALLPLALLWAPVLLAGCDKIPGLAPDPRIAQREAEARAIGGACRHALRGLEDCYALNPRAPKALVFAGWKDMDAYMRENKIDGTPSLFIKPPGSAPGVVTQARAADESAGPGKRD